MIGVTRRYPGVLGSKEESIRIDSVSPVGLVKGHVAGQGVRCDGLRVGFPDALIIVGKSPAAMEMGSECRGWQLREEEWRGAR